MHKSALGKCLREPFTALLQNLTAEDMIIRRHSKTGKPCIGVNFFFKQIRKRKHKNAFCVFGDARTRAHGQKMLTDRLKRTDTPDCILQIFLQGFPADRAHSCASAMMQGIVSTLAKVEKVTVRVATPVS